MSVPSRKERTNWTLGDQPLLGALMETSEKVPGAPQDSRRLNAYYGLPGEVIFCKKCVMSNQRPASAVEYEHTIESKKQTLQFDNDGVCDACRYAEMKDNR